MIPAQVNLLPRHFCSISLPCCRSKLRKILTKSRASIRVPPRGAAEPRYCRVVRHGWLSLLLLAALPASPACAAGPAAWFDEATRYELGNGVAQNSRIAFTLYRYAAQAGLPEAEFNLAAMLDNGRGVAKDIAQAATWYARAASHGNPRAAYNLGLLYQAGEGVPRNVDLARAWFANAPDLPAARTRLIALHAGAPGSGPLMAPTPVAPGAGGDTGSGVGGIELVWTSPSQPEPVRFFVELRAIEGSGSREVFSGFTDTSSVFAPLPDVHGDYAWRVLAIARVAGRYTASDWRRFSIAPD